MPVLAVDKCRPSIRTGDFNDLVRELRSHDLDLVLGETDLLETARGSLETALIYRPTLVAVVAPGIEPREDWENLSLLEYRPSSAYHWEVDAFLKENGLRPRSVGELDDALFMLEAVVRGGFVAFLPRSLAYPAVAQGKVKVLAKLSTTGVGVHALYHASDTLKVARAAVDKLIENARAAYDDAN
jgi:DNA-binding transcriptional LysR family regulator